MRQDMRSYTRESVCCSADIFYAGAPRPEHAFVTNLSEGGAFVQTRHPLRRGDRIFVRLALSENDIAAVTTEVIWGRRFEPIMVDGQLPGVGIRFIDLAPEDRYLIRNYIRTSAEPGACDPPPATPGPDDAVMIPPNPAEPTVSHIFFAAGEEGACGTAAEPQQPRKAWHDTDVDDEEEIEPAIACASDEILFTGYEPALGNLSLPPTPSLPPETSQLSMLQRLPKLAGRSRFTLWLAAGSLVAGIGAGAIYGTVADAPQAAGVAVATGPEERTEPMTPTDDHTTEPTAAPAAKPTAEIVASQAIPTQPTAKPAAKPAIRPAIKPVVKPAATPATQASPGPAPVKVAQAPTGSPAMSTSGDIQLSRPQHTVQGWYISLLGASAATNTFALADPGRLVVDLPPTMAEGLQPCDIDGGPFARMRVGRNSERVRLVIDLDKNITPRRIRFVKKGKDLVLEVPSEALASL